MRVTPRGTSIGSEYRHRDLFSWIGHDLEKDDPSVRHIEAFGVSDPEAWRSRAMSSIFRVSTKAQRRNKLVVSFSVPVWDSVKSC